MWTFLQVSSIRLSPYEDNHFPIFSYIELLEKTKSNPMMLSRSYWMLPKIDARAGLELFLQRLGGIGRHPLSIRKPFLWFSWRTMKSSPLAGTMSHCAHSKDRHMNAVVWTIHLQRVLYENFLWCSIVYFLFCIITSSRVALLVCHKVAVITVAWNSDDQEMK